MERPVLSELLSRLLFLKMCDDFLMRENGIVSKVINVWLA